MLRGIFKKGFAILLLGLIANIAMSQSVALDDQISLNVTDQPLGTVLSQIGDQTSLSFSYNSDKIPLNALVTYKVDSQRLDIVLNHLSAEYHLEYIVVEKQIVLRPSTKLPPLHFNLSGFIADKNTGEALIGATVIIDSTRTGAVANGYGFYSLSLPYGEHSIRISYLGYETHTYVGDINKSIQLDFSLAQAMPQLQEIIVHGFQPQNIELTQTGKVTMSPKSVAEVPVAFGEKDVIKSLELIPGINLQSEGSTFFYVRGGNKDQNLILIDDAPIYNPTHLFGLFSSIVPDAVNSIDVYKSDFPLSKGGRLSSVIDIKTKEGNKNRFSAWGNIGLISTQLGIEGPFKKGQSSYLLTGRLSRIKWLVKQDNPDIEKFQFYDLTGKVNFKLNDKNRLYLSFYTGSDSFLDSSTGLGWTNINGSMRWNKVINKHGFVNTTIYGSNYEYLLHLDRSKNQIWRSRIGEFGLKTDFSHFKGKHELSWGLNINGRTINPGNLVTDDTVAVPAEYVVSVRNNIETVGYFQDEIRSNRWGIKYGLRASLWTSVGESFEYIFNESGLATDTIDYQSGEGYNNYFQIEPRITASYFINEQSSIKGSYGRSVQNLHLMTNSISPFTSFEVWLPSGPNIKPEQADQFSLGYYYYLPKIGISLETEGYYKLMYNQLDYSEHASTLLNPTLESKLITGGAKAYGVEFLAQKQEGRIRGLFGYTLSKVKSTFNEISNGRSFNANSDRPHHLNLNLNYDISLRITVGTNFTYSSGIPFSSPTAFFNYDGIEVPYYEFKNNDRFPSYHRLDLTAKFILNKNLEKNFRHSLTVAVYNLYGRKNPIFINFNKSVNEDGSIEVPTNLLTASRKTTQTFLYRFTPAISYQFRF